ncbi:phosphoribosylformylglycinamidine cyclo-ligase [Nannochloropsis gaditana]|uniref:Phosphoribosylformylglycinamidine cyclo-ligase n=1 Tax=Nannochloropsis gaditana TaxID=72520 RepID=W7T5R5_9STRA|nr:phosphoribosylformylglycinamidine cyclo-ligase [Nannochloropsis gaditana]
MCWGSRKRMIDITQTHIYPFPHKRMVRWKYYLASSISRHLPLLLVMQILVSHAFFTRPLPACAPLKASLLSVRAARGIDGWQNDDAPRYRSRGVSANKHEVLGIVHDQGKKLYPASTSLYPQAFCKILPDMWSNDPEAALVMHADGAGSKAALAYAYWRETGDVSVWKGIAQDALVMNLDDVYCAGAWRAPCLVTSTIARNRRLVPGLVVKHLIDGLEEVAEELRPWGVAVGMAGGETADLGDQVRTLTVDCTLATRMARADVVDNGNIQAGDWIVGLGSSGPPTKYEASAADPGAMYNSGIGSNGLTAARHDVLAPAVGKCYPETYDPALQDTAYCGSRLLTDLVEIPGGRGTGQMTVGKLLLSPTRTYAPFLAQLFESSRGIQDHIHGIVHCTGGGQTKVLRCLPPGRPVHVVKDALFPTPPVFQMIAQEQRKQGEGVWKEGVRWAQEGQKGKDTGISEAWREMYQVFNMGHRMELYIGGGERHANTVIEMAEALGLTAKVVGHVEEEGGVNGGRHCLTVHHANVAKNGGTQKFVYT